MQSAAFAAVSRNSRAAVLQQTDNIIANNHHHLSFIIIALCLTIRAANAVCSRLQKWQQQWQQQRPQQRQRRQPKQQLKRQPLPLSTSLNIVNAYDIKISKKNNVTTQSAAADDACRQRLLLRRDADVDAGAGAGRALFRCWTVLSC